jgi:hypothetical protein
MFLGCLYDVLHVGLPRNLVIAITLSIWNCEVLDALTGALVAHEWVRFPLLGRHFKLSEYEN